MPVCPDVGSVLDISHSQVADVSVRFDTNYRRRLARWAHQIPAECDSNEPGRTYFGWRTSQPAFLAKHKNGAKVWRDGSQFPAMMKTTPARMRLLLRSSDRQILSEGNGFENIKVYSLKSNLQKLRVHAALQRCLHPSPSMWLSLGTFYRNV